MASGRKFESLPPSVAEFLIRSKLDMGNTDTCEVANNFTPQIEKDIEKVSFDFENFECTKENASCYEDLVGFRTLSNGLTFLGCVAGGNWETPVFFIVYSDGKKLRGYVPKSGNLWNYTTKWAFGNDEEEDAKAAAKQWPSLKFKAEIYADDIPDPDIDAIKADILKRITPKGEVKKAPLKMWPTGPIKAAAPKKSKERKKPLYFCVDGSEDEEYFVYISYGKHAVEDNTSAKLEAAVEEVFGSFRERAEIEEHTMENAHMISTFPVLQRFLAHLLQYGARPMPLNPVRLDDSSENALIKKMVGDD